MPPDEGFDANTDDDIEPAKSDNDDEFLQSSPDDRPLGVQLFGDDPLQLAEAARIIEGDCDLIDINMGCPVRKVVNCGAGSALLREPERVREIIGSVRKATFLPLTIKIRIGWQEEQYVLALRPATTTYC